MVGREDAVYPARTFPNGLLPCDNEVRMAAEKSRTGKGHALFTVGEEFGTGDMG